MRIIQVLNHFLPHQIAGTEVYVWALSRGLIGMGHNISVLIPNYEKRESFFYQYDGIDVFQYSEPSVPDRALITGQKKPEGLKNFRQYLVGERPDVVHFHEIAGSNGIGIHHLEAAKEIGAKVVFTMHLASLTCKTGTLMYAGKEICDGSIDLGKCAYCALMRTTQSSMKSGFITSTSMFLRFLGINPMGWQNKIGTALSFPQQIGELKAGVRRVVEATDAMVPITEWYRKILIENGVPKEKLHTVLQALPGDFEPLPVVSHPPLPVRLAFIGRIDPLKGVHLLLEAMEEFGEREILLDIYGGTQDKDFLEKCKKLVVHKPNIRWMGKTTQGKSVSILKGYHALVLPSTFSEMSPLVIQEAFMAGVPVIGSNVYGIAEQVTDGKNGLLFQFGEVSSLVGTLQKIKTDPALLAHLAMNCTQSRLFKNVVNETEYIYSSIL